MWFLILSPRVYFFFQFAYYIPHLFSIVSCGALYFIPSFINFILVAVHVSSFAHYINTGWYMLATNVRIASMFSPIKFLLI